MRGILKYKAFLFTLIAVFIMTVSGVFSAMAEEDKPTGELSVSGLTKYIWRGYENTRHSIVVQPSMTVGYKGFSANLWGNLDTEPYSTTGGSNSSTWTETDFTLSYTKAIGIVNAGLGYIYYNLGAPNAGAVKPLDSQEIFVTLGLNKLLSPTLTVYKEIDHYHQWYFLLGISHAFEFNKTVSLKLGASASYLLSDYADAARYNVQPSYGGYPKFNKNYQATNDKFSNFHDGVLTASLPINLAKYVTVSPMVSYVFPLSSDAENEMKARGKKTDLAGNDSSHFYGGITITLSF
jgi:hypothetical protein